MVDKNTNHLDICFIMTPSGVFGFYTWRNRKKLPKSSVWDGMAAPILITWRCEVPKRLWPPWRFTKSWFLDGSVEITTVSNLSFLDVPWCFFKTSSVLSTTTFFLSGPQFVYCFFPQTNSWVEKIQAVGMLVNPPVPCHRTMKDCFRETPQKWNDYPIHLAAGFLWIAP